MTRETLESVFARPIAHRGLHDVERGRIENSLGSALAAVAGGYAIECDLRLSADGEPMVFHDETLERLTTQEGPVERKTFAELTALTLKGSSETIPSFAALLAAVEMRVPLIVELKAGFDGDTTLARRVAALLADYDGPVAIESFDPDPIAFLRAEGGALGVGGVPLGIVAQATYDAPEWPDLSPEKRAELACFGHFARTRPQFLSFRREDYPHVAPVLFRQALRLPVSAWTIRSKGQALSASQWADAIVFEGFAP